MRKRRGKVTRKVRNGGGGGVPRPFPRTIRGGMVLGAEYGNLGRRGISAAYFPWIHYGGVNYNGGGDCRLLKNGAAKKGASQQSWRSGREESLQTFVRGRKEDLAKAEKGIVSLHVQVKDGQPSAFRRSRPPRRRRSPCASRLWNC